MTDELKRLHQSVSHDVEVALREAYRLGCNAGLANKLTEGMTNLRFDAINRSPSSDRF
mgnify:CR=1 FL=1